LKPFQEYRKEETKGKGNPSHHLAEDPDIEKLATFEVNLDEKQSETLFKITTQIEDVEGALRQAEQLVKRLKDRLQQLRDLQRVLSKRS
jgi:hypothetical protein